MLLYGVSGKQTTLGRVSMDSAFCISYTEYGVLLHSIFILFYFINIVISYWSLRIRSSLCIFNLIYEDLLDPSDPLFIWRRSLQGLTAAYGVREYECIMHIDVGVVKLSPYNLNLSPPYVLRRYNQGKRAIVHQH